MANSADFLQCLKNLMGTRGGGKSHIPEVVAVILNDNKTALLKSVVKTVMDPPWWP